MSTQLLKGSGDQPCSKQKTCQCEIDGSDVCEDTLDKFIHRILLSASMNENDGDGFGIADVDDGKLVPLDYRNKPKINSVRLQERYDKARKNTNRKKETKKSKWQKGKDDDRPMPRGTVQKVDGNSYVHVPLEVYRRMVEAEIDAKMKQVKEYQEYYLKKQDDIRLESLRDVFYWKEYSKSLQSSLSTALEDLQNSEEALDITSKRLQMYESTVPCITEKLFEPWMVETARAEVQILAPTPRNLKNFRRGSKRQQKFQTSFEKFSKLLEPSTVHPPEPNSKSNPEKKMSKVRLSSSAAELGTGNPSTKTSKQRRNKILRGLAKDTDDLPKTT